MDPKRKLIDGSKNKLPECNVTFRKGSECNQDKSEAVLFGNNVPSELKFGIHNILIKPQLEYLGIVIADKLTFNDHCARVKNIVLQLLCSVSKKCLSKVSTVILL